ncbi:hypothetical protein BNJ_00207 [Kaumoebavirus]|uniref:hypothetical protein n=1 Tax=Kaumoebavirus TaxID=1859492 RepID=UPI0009C293A9|nr:hypothetical protein BNJ_00207 [Kaumoebavirus]ARA72037.1 hypothetical protein BNJ_00207 [Kaumoebavirus]
MDFLYRLLTSPTRLAIFVCVHVAMTQAFLIWNGEMKTDYWKLGPRDTLQIQGYVINTPLRYLLAMLYTIYEELLLSAVGYTIGIKLTLYVLNRQAPPEPGHGLAIAVFWMFVSELFGFNNWLLTFKTDISAVDFSIAQFATDIAVGAFMYRRAFQQKREQFGDIEKGIYAPIQA